jgi:hypothetical protein
MKNNLLVDSVCLFHELSEKSITTPQELSGHCNAVVNPGKDCAFGVEHKRNTSALTPRLC